MYICILYMYVYIYVYVYVYISVCENVLSLHCLVVFDIVLTIFFFTFLYYDHKFYQSFDR